MKNKMKSYSARKFELEILQLNHLPYHLKNIFVVVLQCFKDVKMKKRFIYIMNVDDTWNLNRLAMQNFRARLFDKTNPTKLLVN